MRDPAVDQPKQLAIFGASVRAAAFSAMRAGFTPWCADLFADADLRLCCPVVRLHPKEYPGRFLDLARRLPGIPWIYTGGLENHARLVHQITQHLPLWGNNADVLRRARSPFFVAGVLQQAGMPHAAVYARPDEIPEGEICLIKPLQSAGGGRIDFWRAQGERLASSYFQEFIAGKSYAALFVADHEHVRLLGITRQLVGIPWLTAGSFDYCGSIGPVALAPATQQAVERLGAVLGAGCGLRGLFGVDFILRKNVPYPVEINPRYTASVEVLEHALGLPALTLHAQACAPDSGPTMVCSPAPRGEQIGKAIVFALAGPVCFPSKGPWSATLAAPRTPWDVPAYADIPAAEEEIPGDRPILTVFAHGKSFQACRLALRARAQDLLRDVDNA
jgi:predicted ATP-grasp superfamily ATP-dependent carboligase